MHALTNKELVFRALDQLHRAILPMVEGRLNDGVAHGPSAGTQGSRDDVQYLLSLLVDDGDTGQEHDAEVRRLAAEVMELTRTAHFQRAMPLVDATDIFEAIGRLLHLTEASAHAMAVGELHMQLHVPWRSSHGGDGAYGGGDGHHGVDHGGFLMGGADGGDGG
ncbi:hypothetical protein [Myceligenerans indicum]|uniref:Uncharacterized protein n=1 Tax=Myceligenerans indicum TaxID=2593663 RepID=A0ABS1LLZ1_9MICO|nr:hypothetical protein [Myceligenerans indicum]MBL0887236.1 hypothetical protein [Myceligenerans indicum]